MFGEHHIVNRPSKGQTCLDFKDLKLFFHNTMDKVLLSKHRAINGL